VFSYDKYDMIINEDYLDNVEVADENPADEV
jgi:hypothetical protein